MSEPNSQPPKYQIELNQTQGSVIGDNVQVEQHFHAASPPPPPATRDELLAAI